MFSYAVVTNSTVSCWKSVHLPVLTHSSPLSSLHPVCRPLGSTCSLCQAHHVSLRTLPLRWWASCKCRPHGVATSTHCFLYHLRKQGEQRTMRCHFLNPFVLFYTFFFFVQLVLLFPSPPPPSPSSHSTESRPDFPHKMFLHRHPSFPLNVSFFFVFLFFFSSSLVFTVEQWWRGPWDIHDHPLPSLTVWLVLYLPAKWLVLTRTGHQKMNPLLAQTHP